MRQIVVPQLNANDNSCLIQNYYCGEGEFIHSGDLITTLETSKAAIDVECEADGYFYPAAKEQTDVKTGEVIAFIFETLQEMNTYKELSVGSAAAESTANYKLSNQAEAFAALHQFSQQELSSLNKKLIKLSDLEELLKQRMNGDEARILLSKNQKQVSKTVAESHTNIPNAFLLMKVYCDEALTGMREIGEQLEVIVGFGEVLPVLLVSIKDEFPLMYGKMKDENTFIPADEVNVGVTIDVGTGLYIPVIKAEHAGSIEHTAEIMMEYKYKALRSSFAEADLMNGTITISLNTSADVVSVIPIILPGQTGMISVGAVMKELVLKEGTVAERSYINLGLAYDHRVVNGFYAVEFLARLKSKIEHFEINV
ncbi:2-oxo acid dehydrogenase subunit E2 [Paenibacillus sp. FSL R7-0210]|uniref:2-oxo acid dehydrogenase subunit E2 n=1 Tax=Paenibacillus sp. FSL R7-0210 TaxID=2921676 RepID=UPI0030FC1387